jgi:hypothetical protein
MKTAREMYSTYKIMPSLQLHQLRVAAVGKLICDNFKQQVNERDVILACLFHDMGNIIKSDPSYFPEFIASEGLEYWERVKVDFVDRYGNDAHTANVSIAREIGLSEEIVALIDAVDFLHSAEICATSSWELKILQYADMRVGPHSVLPLGERLFEGRARYAARNIRLFDTDEAFEQFSRLAHEFERRIFVETTIKPGGITDATVAPLFEELREYPVAQ